MTLNFDQNLVPFPPYEFKLALNKVDRHGQDNFGKREMHGVTFHRGITGNQTLDGAVGYLIAPSTAGLTDGYIDNNTGRVVMMNPMVELFPDVLKLVPNWEDRAGWANGPYGGSPFNANNPSADGRAFVAKYGYRTSRWGAANVVNQDTENFEILGNYDTYISDKCKRVMAQIVANRAQRNKIPWDKYPINPATGVTELFGHRDFCGTAWKLCPGSVVWTFINGPMITMVRDILRSAQVDGKRVAVDGTTVNPTPEAPVPSTPRTFEIRFETPIRTSPGFWDYEKNKPNVVSTLKAGTTGEVISGPKTVDGIDFYDLKVDGLGTGWVQDQVLHTMVIKEAT